MPQFTKEQIDDFELVKSHHPTKYGDQKYGQVRSHGCVVDVGTKGLEQCTDEDGTVYYQYKKIPITVNSDGEGTVSATFRPFDDKHAISVEITRIDEEGDTLYELGGIIGRYLLGSSGLTLRQDILTVCEIADQICDLEMRKKQFTQTH